VIGLVIETEKLTKYYGKRIGCMDISIFVERGEVFAFLGPNGAGKSTFIKMLTGLLFPTSGKACLLGEPLGNIEVRKKIGYLPENFRYQDWMTGEDLLSFHASLYKLEKKKTRAKIEEVLELTGLKGSEKYRIGTYSKGMQQRIGIASSLLCDPELIFMDEPTSALDPIGRKEVREIILMLKGMGKTIFLNSHLLSEVEMVCSSAAFINKGRIINQGKLEDLTEGSITLEIHAEGINDEVMDKIRKIDGNASQSGNKITMSVRDNDDINDIASLIIRNGGKLYELSPRRESLENIFIRVMGEMK
jgi:ABC-2 type transport system ATP-binding protein